MRIVTPEKWTPCDGVVLETNAEEAVRIDSNILVVAGPGAGKTELLAQKASYLFQTNKCRDPQKILAISFKNDAADNLKKRVIKRCGNEIGNRFISLTYDAFSKSILDHFCFALPENIRPKASYSVNENETIDAAFRKAGYINPQRLSTSRLRNYYDKILSSVTLPLAKNDLGENVWRLLLKGFDDYNASVSFKMICILAEYIIRINPMIRKGLQLTYGHVFLDEFQDTTNLQYKLVKQCFLNSNSLMTAVGDNKQRIMVWAGALKTVFSNFEEDFCAVQRKLIMNHRSAPRLVKLQEMMYLSLKETELSVDVSDKWNPNDGTVSLLIADNEENEAQVITNDIIEKLSNNILPNELCILCKLLKYILKFWGISRIKALLPIYNQGTYLNDLLTKFQNFMWEELEFTQINWLLAIENFEGLHSIPIMTIHKSKGLEYEAVYFVGLEDSAFWNFKNQSEEDRCAFFVALSRAKSEIMFTFCNYRSGIRKHRQTHSEINEFFDLLKTPGMATII